MTIYSTTAQNYEQVSYNPPGLSQHSARARGVIAVTADRTLLPRESGSLVVFDVAAGAVVTLPTPVAGMEFEFLVTTTITSNNAKIITNSSSVFLLGEVLMYTTATASPAGFAFNGSTHVACTMNGTTTGAIIGTRIKVTALPTTSATATTSTQWFIEGAIVGSGIIATPAATS